MRALFVGDVFGNPGRRILKPALRLLRERHAPDVVVVNGENAAAGAGLVMGRNSYLGGHSVWYSDSARASHRAPRHACDPISELH